MLNAGHYVSSKLKIAPLGGTIVVLIIAWMMAAAWQLRPASPYEAPRSYPAVSLPNSVTYDLGFPDMVDPISCDGIHFDLPGCFEPHGFSVHADNRPIAYIPEEQVRRQRIDTLICLIAVPLALAFAAGTIRVSRNAFPATRTVAANHRKRQRSYRKPAGFDRRFI